MQLRAGHYELDVLPELGGAVGRFDWQGRPLFRPGRGPSPLDTGCFPLVPFSNRIGSGRFRFRGSEVVIPPNAPALDPRNPIHGFGWLSAWTVLERSGRSATLEHRHGAAAWPWDYGAVQRFELGEEGLRISLAITNLSERPMPAGLGLHPYFPKGADTRYCGLHRHEWHNDSAGLPTECSDAGSPIDWWDGTSVGSRSVDTIYTGRHGPLSIIWPGAGAILEMRPARNLPMTVVYVPEGQDYFCVEPVSHLTDAVARCHASGPMRIIPPGKTMKTWIDFRAYPIT